MMTASTKGTLLALALALTSVGCGGVIGDYCEARCECEGCSDRELEECEIRREGRMDYADIYECGAEYEEYLQCRVDESSCENNPDGGDDYWTAGGDCDNEDDDYDDCIDDARDESLVPGLG